jgi:GNAT superfamily N-acetyltransferase
MDAVARYLAVYDDQLRTARTAAASSVRRMGPLYLLTLDRGHGFVTYRDLDGVSTGSMSPLVEAVLDHFRSDNSIELVDWKTCSHDRTPGLPDALLGHGFIVDAEESVMIGEASRLAVRTSLPPGVTLRRITSRDDVAAMEEMQGAVFGDPDWRRRVDVMMRRLAVGDGMQMWAAEFGGKIITAGRLEPVPGTDFADLCGGATRPDWRGRGIYRALTAERARAALQLGHTLLHSSSTEYSRPILERAGLTKVATNQTSARAYADLLTPPTGGFGRTSLRGLPTFPNDGRLRRAPHEVDHKRTCQPLDRPLGASAGDQAPSMVTFALFDDPGIAGPVLPAGRLSGGSLMRTCSQRLISTAPHFFLEIWLGRKERSNANLAAVSVCAGGVGGERTRRIMLPMTAESRRHCSADGVGILRRPHLHHGLMHIHPPHTQKRRTANAARTRPLSALGTQGSSRHPVPVDGRPTTIEE